MQPNPLFQNMPKSFWACVRLLSQKVGYTDRSASQIKVPTLHEMASALHSLNLDPNILGAGRDGVNSLGNDLYAYFYYRADVLNNYVVTKLMDAEEAEVEYQALYNKLSPLCPLPMNKQSGDKKRVAYLTAMVNMLVEFYTGGMPCDYDPRELTTITRNGIPVRTLARRVDGAFPRAVNPIAIWEIKEYYYTKTFGSRVADGVYETLLDGMELEELREHELIDVKHYLMVDSHYTWWVCGRSYLCRMIDMLHMGYVDEILFGREVIEQLPRIVQEWVQQEKLRQSGELVLT